MAIPNAIVPVAGLGTRLLPATKAQPKEMLPVGGKPVVQHVVEELASCGVRRVVLVTGRGKGAIEDHFDADPELERALRDAGRAELADEVDLGRLGVQLAYVRQRRPLGLGDAILAAEPFAGDGPCVVALGDSVIGRHEPSRIVARLVEAFEEADAVCAVAVEEVAAEDLGRYGVVAPAGDGEVFGLTGLVEKPGPAAAPSRLAVVARYVIGPAVFAALRAAPPGPEGELGLTEALAGLAAEGATMVGVRLAAGERRFDVGTPLSYGAAFLEFALTDPADGAALRERARALLDEQR